MKDNPLVSVIVPIYNVEQYLPKCLDSILNQTYSNLEIILVDDGSPDGCGQICDAYAQKDERIVVIHQENAGLAGARNAGIAIAKGEYLGFVDSDDWIAPEMYETLLKSLCEHDCEIAICGRYSVWDADTMIPSFGLESPLVMNHEEAVRHYLLCDIFDVAAWDKLYKRELFDGVEYPLGFVSEDVPVTYALLAKSNKVVHCGVPLYYYLHRGGSLSRSRFSPKSMGLYHYFKEVWEKCKQEFPHLSLESDYFYLKNLLVLFYLLASESEKFPQYREIRREVMVHWRAILKNPYIRKGYKIFTLAAMLHLDKAAVKVSGWLPMYQNQFV